MVKYNGQKVHKVRIDKRFGIGVLLDYNKKQKHWCYPGSKKIFKGAIIS